MNAHSPKWAVFVVCVLAAAAVAYGAAWVTDTTNTNPGVSAACSADGQTVYIVNGYGFFKSTDGGASFRQIKPVYQK